MKQKQFFFALVAMLSFVFSAFAQTTVTSEAELKAALTSSTGGEITLAEDVTLKENIETGNGNYTLNLNNHQIKGDFSGYVLKVGGTLTIKGNGEITGKTTILYCKSGGTINIEGGAIHNNSNNNVIFTVGTLNVYGGSILSTASPNRAIEGAGSGKINLYGGTVTSLVVTKGALNIAGINVTVENGINVGKNAGNVNISAGTIKGDVTIADEAKSKVTISGGSFEDTQAIKDYLPSGSALLQKPDGTYEIVAGLLKIGDTYYPTLDAAFKAAQNGATIELINQEGAVIAMNGSLYGKNVTITGTAKVDWNKGFLFVGRGGEGNATLTFDNANLTSASNSSSYGIHVSGREKDTNNKYDGTLVIKNSTIVLDYLINKGAMTLDNSTLTVKNGFDLNGRPAKETENGEDANATLALTNNSKLVVNNHNGMGIGREGKGELTVDASSTFEHTLDFLVCANGTMDVKGTLVSNGKKLTNNGEVKFTATKLTAATIEGTGTTRFYNDVNFYGANSITTGINGTPFHLVVNEGANLFITRFVLGYDRNITVNGTITDASAFNPAGQTPSLKFNSTSGVSVGGTGTGNLTVNNAYIELGNSSWKNAQGTYDWDFVNSYVSATSFTNATGADAATWDVTFDKSVLDAKNYIKNGKNVTYNFTNNSRGTTGSLRIDGVLNIDATSSVVTTSQQNNKVGAVDEHGGINGTVNVAGNLTIGSNAKTQLEVLGGTVNVVNGATLALGNNTMTLDAASALQSAGNISGAITAANGANVAITGGTYTQDVSNWCADGFMTQQNADGSFGIAKAAAKVGDKKYASLETAFKAATSGCTIEILSDVTVDYAWDARNTGGKFTVPVTINGNGKTIKFTASVNDNNYQAPFRFEADATVKNLTIDMSEVTDNCFRAISSKGNLTVDGCKFIGKDESLNCRAIIFGEGAGANVGNLAISITNSEFINWKRGITDNENAQDVKTVTITGNTMTDAGIGVSAKETVTFTGNTVAGAYVNIKSYTAGNKLAVTATGNTLEANTDAAYNVIDAGGVVNAEGFKVVAKGNNFNGYTNTDGIWGETWGNAKESFVVKVLDANGNVMGTTSLNNIGGIIDGDVNVSWNLKFNAAANTDEYWTMAWTTVPSISNMPARVALWVDGVEVSGGPVVLNGPDDLNKIVAAATDADGKILSCHTSVANAAATNATNIALLRNTTEEIILPAGVKLNANGFTAANVKTAVAVIGTQKFASLQDAIEFAKAGDVVTIMPGTYPVPAMKAGITVEGEGEVLLEGTLSGTLENLTLKNLHIKGGNAQRWAYAKGDLVFENVTFEATSIYALHFDGIAAGTNLTYKNCTIIGWAAMGGTPASCVFEGCTIKGNGSYGVIRTYFDATIKDCTFDVANVNTTDAYEDGIHAVNGAKVVVTNCTNKNGEMKDLVNVHATSEVTVDGTVYKNVAKVGDNYYATLVEAFATVGDGAGKTIELIADVDLAGAEWTPVTFNGVFDGQNHTISNLVVNGAGKSNQGFFAQTNNGEIKNVTFDNAKVTGRLNVGVVAGTPYTSKYTNVKVTGHVEVNGMAYVGGVGGKNAYANWTDITVNVDETSYVKATSTENDKKYRTYVGGVIGFNGEGGHTFKNISSNIKVIGDVMDIGGIFGILHYGNNAENITFTGAVEAPAEAKEVGGIAGVWHNQQGQTVTITEAKSEGTVKVGDVTTTGSIVGGAYNAANQSPATSGSLMIDGKEVWVGLAKVGEVPYETLAAAVAAAQAGDTITLIDNVEATEVILLGKSLTINGNGYKVTSNATRVFRATTSNTEITLNDVNMVNTAERVGTNDIRGISVDDVQNVKLTLNSCSVDFTDASANDWTYAVNVVGGSGHVVTVNGGAYEGANVINVRGANQTVTVKDAVLTSLYPNNDTYYGACIYVVQNANSSVEATGNTFNGDNAIAFNVGYTPVEESDNIDNTKYVVAMIGDAYYTSIQDAIEAAQDGETVKLTQNVTIDELVKLEKAITLDLNDKKVTSTAMKAFEVYANATIKNGTIEAVQRCVDTRKAVELTLTDVTLIADKYTSYGNPQPLTIGGYENGTKVTMTNVNISAADGYGIITFVKTELTATNSTIAGYSALYVKPGSDNSVFNFTKSALSGSNAGNDVEGNSFSTIAVRANNVTVNVDAASTVTAVGNYCDAMSFGGNYAGEESVTDANVTIAGTINGNIMFAGLALNNNVISVKAEYADELATAGFVTSEADATGLVTIRDVTVLNEMTIEHSAYAGLEFVNENEKEVGTLNYVRNFSNTNWQAFYVPFAINYDDIKDDFDVARLNMAHKEEIDGKVQIKIEFISMKAGQTMKANYPYMIRPKQAGEYTITVENTTLKKTVSRSIDCSTVDVKFTFTGTYRTIFGDELVGYKYYYMGGGILGFTTNRKYKLNPFNWYMTMEGREDLSDVKFVFGGDFEDEETTGITNIDNDQKNDGNIYDLQGRRVLHPQKGSLYIVNGKKVVY